MTRNNEKKCLRLILAMAHDKDMQAKVKENTIKSKEVEMKKRQNMNKHL